MPERSVTERIATSFPAEMEFFAGVMLKWFGMGSEEAWT